MHRHDLDLLENSIKHKSDQTVGVKKYPPTNVKFVRTEISARHKDLITLAWYLNHKQGIKINMTLPLNTHIIFPSG